MIGWKLATPGELIGRARLARGDGQSSLGRAPAIIGRVLKLYLAAVLDHYRRMGPFRCFYFSKQALHLLIQDPTRSKEEV